jgi:hypothetical protein
MQLSKLHHLLSGAMAAATLLAAAPALAGPASPPQPYAGLRKTIGGDILTLQ